MIWQAIQLKIQDLLSRIIIKTVLTALFMKDVFRSNWYSWWAKQRTNTSRGWSSQLCPSGEQFWGHLAFLAPNYTMGALLLLLPLILPTRPLNQPTFHLTFVIFSVFVFLSVFVFVFLSVFLFVFVFVFPAPPSPPHITHQTFKPTHFPPLHLSNIIINQMFIKF